MKKLMVLALVLGIGSMAAAGLEFQVDGSAALGQEVLPGTLSIVETETAPGFDVTFTFDGVSYDTSGLTFPTTFEIAPKIETGTDTVLRVTGAQLFGADVGGTFVDGIQLSGEGTIGVYNEMTGADLGTISVVPEPMTLGLLGIGGLFLRRRK